MLEGLYHCISLGEKGFKQVKLTASADFLLWNKQIFLKMRLKESIAR
jgi:hypothetical protein